MGKIDSFRTYHTMKTTRFAFEHQQLFEHFRVYDPKYQLHATQESRVEKGSAL